MMVCLLPGGLLVVTNPTHSHHLYPPLHPKDFVFIHTHEKNHGQKHGTARACNGGVWVYLSCEVK